MLTPQEVSSHTFTKAVMGGYNMAMVDEFLDELTDDYNSLYKENAALKAKLKVLVDKVEEYRTTEESMRATLLTAQRMADSIVQEAQTKRDEMLAAAEAESRDKLQAMQQELDQGEMRLQRGKEDLARFISTYRSVCQQELALLDQLPELEFDLPKPPAAEDPVADEIGEQIFASFARAEFPGEMETPEPPQESVDAEPEAVPADDVSAEPAADAAPESAGAADADLFAETRRINLQDLKFGRNYEGDN